MSLQVEALIDGLKNFVAQGEHRGVLLEATKSVPTGFEWAGVEDRIGRWLRPGQPRAAQVPDFTPAAYRAFLESHGSLTWLAPAHDAPDGWFFLHNQGPQTLIELPEGHRCIDVYDPIPDEEEQARLGLSHLWVFHDGYNESFAFDERIIGTNGEPLVIEFKEEHLMTPLEDRLQSVVRHGTFTEWLAKRIRHFTSALGPRAAPPRMPTAGGRTAPPNTLVLPAPRTTGLSSDDNMRFELALDPGWQALERGDFADALRCAQAARALNADSPYPVSMALDALAGLAVTAPDPSALRQQQFDLAWFLLAMCRRNTFYQVHGDFVKLYRQKAATLLAELSLLAPGLVSPADAKLLLTEAKAVRVGADEQMAMTGRWNVADVEARLRAATS